MTRLMIHGENGGMVWYSFGSKEEAVNWLYERLPYFQNIAYITLT